MHWLKLTNGNRYLNVDRIAQVVIWRNDDGTTRELTVLWAIPSYERNGDGVGWSDFERERFHGADANAIEAALSTLAYEADR